MTKEFILSEIQRTAEDNDGIPLGKIRFFQASGLKESDWYGKYWTKWSDALIEAGYKPNMLNTSMSSDHLLQKLSELIEDLKRFPASGDLQIKASNDRDFLSHNTFNRFGNKAGLATALKEYCVKKGKLELLQFIPNIEAKLTQKGSNEKIEENGSVYLYKSGRHYKIGRSIDLKRRDREIKLQLPVEAELIHRIITDDPIGIE